MIYNYKVVDNNIFQDYTHSTPTEIHHGGEVAIQGVRFLMLYDGRLCYRQNAAMDYKGRWINTREGIMIGEHRYHKNSGSIAYCNYTHGYNKKTNMVEDRKGELVSKKWAEVNMFVYPDGKRYIIPLADELEEETEDRTDGASGENLNVGHKEGQIGDTSDIKEEPERIKEVREFSLSEKIIVELHSFYSSSTRKILHKQFYNKDLFLEEFELNVESDDGEKISRVVEKAIERQYIEDRTSYSVQNIYEKDDRWYISYVIQKKEELIPKDVRDQRLSQFLTQCGYDANTLLQKTLGINKKLRCAWGNTIEHKEEFSRCQIILNTCQKKENQRSLSAGYGTAFTNGYIQPLLVYGDELKKDFLGRLMIRELYTAKGEKIIMIDRLYMVDGKIASKKAYFYEALAKNLLEKGHRIVIPCTTAHENKSTTDMLDQEIDSNVVRKSKRSGVLRSGLYKCVRIEGQFVSYYNDSNTRTNQTMIDKKIRHFDILENNRYMELIGFNNESGYETEQATDF